MHQQGRIRRAMTVDLDVHNGNVFFFSSRRRHTRSLRDWSSDVCSSDLVGGIADLALPRQEDQDVTGSLAAQFSDRVGDRLSLVTRLRLTVADALIRRGQRPVA